jgi:hypothetical protein
MPMDESEQYSKVCQPQLDRIENHTAKIFRILEGNGGTGLVEHVARHDERIKSLQSWKKWAIGFATSLLVIFIVYLLTN